MNVVEWMQRRLVAFGFDPGVVDGIWGRNTLRAMNQFQRSVNLPVTETITQATVAALKAGAAAAAGPATPKTKLLDAFPWMELAQRKKGLHELKDNAELRKFLKSDGKTLGDPAQSPWCGDFVETCIGLTLPSAVLPSNPYLARNWLKFGQTVDPCFGSILIFWRGEMSGTQGHVGFYYSEDADSYHVLGGNTANSVSVGSLAKSRLLGARLPSVGVTFPRVKVSSEDDFETSVNEV
jgi:uncharacterized protein (TIGR02594 family)